MKHTSLLSLVSLILGTSLLAADLQTLLTQGQTAMARGDITTAKSAFQAANQLDPKNPTAIGFLKQIAVQEAKSPASSGTEKQLAALIIPQIQFREATFGSALDFLRKKAVELSGGKQTINFVVAPGIDQDATKITLSLANIPFTEALRYMAELANAKVEYQKFAVMIRPVGPAPVAAEKPAQ